MDMNEIRDHAADLLSALQEDRKIGALKAIRAMTGCGLCESKTIYDMFNKAYGKPDAFKPLFPADEQPQYIVACQSDYETWTNIFNSEQSAMDYAEGHTPKENVTVGKVIAKSVAKTTYTLEKV